MAFYLSLNWGSALTKFAPFACCSGAVTRLFYRNQPLPAVLLCFGLPTVYLLDPSLCAIFPGSIGLGTEGHLALSPPSPCIYTPVPCQEKHGLSLPLAERQMLTGPSKANSDSKLIPTPEHPGPHPGPEHCVDTEEGETVNEAKSKCSCSSRDSVNTEHQFR